MDANSKVIEDIYAAFAKGDIPFILERLSADVQFDNSDSAEMPYGGTYRGKDGVGKFFANIGGAVDVTGKSFKSQWAMRFIVKNGKVTYAHVYEDTAVTAAALR